jgi:hypothetical protein
MRNPNIAAQSTNDNGTQLSPRVAALREKMRASRGRLIFALDATASREPTWDMAMQLQAEMFDEAAKIGGLDVQVMYYRGCDEVRASSFVAGADALINWMSTVNCLAGTTRIARVLRFIRKMHDREKVAAAIFIGDAVEELPAELYDAAAAVNVPMFVFQEGDDVQVEQIFREIARLSGGAYGKFDAGAAKHLAELLRAVAAFAVGGVTALENQRTDSARKLLGQMK